MTIDVNAVLSLLVNVTVLIAAVAAGVVWLRKWLKAQVSDPMARVEKQVKPNGGTQDTSRHLIEQIHDEVRTLGSTAESNRTLAEKALAVAAESLAISKTTSERLDSHLLGHGGG